MDDAAIIAKSGELFRGSYIIVRAKESLEKAIEDNVRNIVVKGELAEELNVALSSKLPNRLEMTTSQVNCLNPLAIVLGVAVTAIPFAAWFGTATTAAAATAAATTATSATTPI